MTKYINAFIKKKTKVNCRKVEDKHEELLSAGVSMATLPPVMNTLTILAKTWLNLMDHRWTQAAATAEPEQLSCKMGGSCVMNDVMESTQAAIVNACVCELLRMGAEKKKSKEDIVASLQAMLLDFMRFCSGELRSRVKLMLSLLKWSELTHVELLRLVQDIAHFKETDEALRAMVNLAPTESMYTDATSKASTLKKAHENESVLQEIGGDMQAFTADKTSWFEDAHKLATRITEACHDIKIQGSSGEQFRDNTVNHFSQKISKKITDLTVSFMVAFHTKHREVTDTKRQTLKEMGLEEYTDGLELDDSIMTHIRKFIGSSVSFSKVLFMMQGIDSQFKKLGSEIPPKHLGSVQITCALFDLLKACLHLNEFLLEGKLAPTGRFQEAEKRVGGVSKSLKALRAQTFEVAHHSAEDVVFVAPCVVCSACRAVSYLFVFGRVLRTFPNRSPSARSSAHSLPRGLRVSPLRSWAPSRWSSRVRISPTSTWRPSTLSTL